MIQGWSHGRDIDQSDIVRSGAERADIQCSTDISRIDIGDVHYTGSDHTGVNNKGMDHAGINLTRTNDAELNDAELNDAGIDDAGSNYRGIENTVTDQTGMNYAGLDDVDDILACSKQSEISEIHLVTKSSQCQTEMNVSQSDSCSQTESGMSSSANQTETTSQTQLDVCSSENQTELHLHNSGNQTEFSSENDAINHRLRLNERESGPQQPYTDSPIPLAQSLNDLNSAFDQVTTTVPNFIRFQSSDQNLTFYGKALSCESQTEVNAYSSQSQTEQNVNSMQCQTEFFINHGSCQTDVYTSSEASQTYHDVESTICQTEFGSSQTDFDSSFKLEIGSARNLNQVEHNEEDSMHNEIHRRNSGYSDVSTARDVNRTMESLSSLMSQGPRGLQRTIETQTYPELREIETQTLRRIDGIATQTSVEGVPILPTSVNQNEDVGAQGNVSIIQGKNEAAGFFAQKFDDHRSGVNNRSRHVDEEDREVEEMFIRRRTSETAVGSSPPPSDSPFLFSFRRRTDVSRGGQEQERSTDLPRQLEVLVARSDHVVRVLSGDQESGSQHGRDDMQTTSQAAKRATNASGNLKRPDEVDSVRGVHLDRGSEENSRDESMRDAGSRSMQSVNAQLALEEEQDDAHEDLSQYYLRIEEEVTPGQTGSSKGLTFGNLEENAEGLGQHMQHWEESGNTRSSLVTLKQDLLHQVPSEERNAEEDQLTIRHEQRMSSTDMREPSYAGRSSVAESRGEQSHFGYTSHFSDTVPVGTGIRSRLEHQRENNQAESNQYDEIRRNTSTNQHSTTQHSTDANFRSNEEISRALSQPVANQRTNISEMPLGMGAGRVETWRIRGVAESNLTHRVVGFLSDLRLDEGEGHLYESGQSLDQHSRQGQRLVGTRAEESIRSREETPGFRDLRARSTDDQLTNRGFYTEQDVSRQQIRANIYDGNTSSPVRVNIDLESEAEAHHLRGQGRGPVTSSPVGSRRERFDPQLPSRLIYEPFHSAYRSASLNFARNGAAASTVDLSTSDDSSADDRFLHRQ